MLVHAGLILLQCSVAYTVTDVQSGEENVCSVGDVLLQIFSETKPKELQQLIGTVLQL